MRDNHLNPCSVCGKMVADENNKMHIRSDFHQAALGKLNPVPKTEIPEPEPNERLGIQKSKPPDPKIQQLDIQPKPVPSIKPKPDDSNDKVEDKEEWKGFFPDD